MPDLLLQELEREFGQTKAVTSFAVSMFHAVPLLVGPVASALTDRSDTTWGRHCPSFYDFPQQDFIKLPLIKILTEANLAFYGTCPRTPTVLRKKDMG